MMQFLQEFASAPARTGAIAPSSTYLAKEIVSDLNLSKAEAVLEYGPGTGAFTRFILSNLSPSCKFVAIEVNSKFAEELRAKFPGLNLHNGSVAQARQICDQHRISMVDCIVSGLPWATFSAKTQQIFLDEMMRVLKPGGRFATFGYVHSQLLPGAQKFAGTLPKYFSNITRSRIVWANLPPAFVYRCRR